MIEWLFAQLFGPLIMFIISWDPIMGPVLAKIFMI